MTKEGSAEATTRDIKRKTRRKYSAMNSSVLYMTPPWMRRALEDTATPGGRRTYSPVRQATRAVYHTARQR